MFCPNCGANLPDGSAFCGSCGANLKKQQEPAQQPQYQAPPQPQYQQPAYQPPYPPVNRGPVPISKKEFLAQKADASTKQSAKLVTITFILSLVLIVASIIAPLAMPFYDIPAMDMVLTLAEADPDELIDEMEASLEEAEYRYDVSKKTMDRDERDAAKQVIDSLEKLVDNFSVLNFTSLVSVTEKVGDDYMDNADLDELEEINQIMSIVIGALIGSFLLPALFALLGGLNKSTGLTVAALVFTVLSQLSLCGFLFVVLSLAIFIFQAVQCNKIQKAYQAYRTGRPM